MRALAWLLKMLFETIKDESRAIVAGLQMSPKFD
jgi:hypothetical protein